VGAITNTKLTYKSETDALVIGAISIDRLSMECTEFARRRSLGLALSGSSFQRGDFPCFEKPSSLLPFLPRLVEQSLLPRLMLPRVEVAVGADMAVAVAGVDMAVAAAGVVVTVVAGSAVVTVVAGSAVVTVVAGSAVVTVVADSGVDMLAELAVGTLVALVAGMLVALVAVGLGVAVSVVARLAVSAAGWVVCAEPRLVLVSGQLDLMASAGEASESPAFTAGAFQSRQV
jgi:hypothetical protein